MRSVRSFIVLVTSAVLATGCGGSDSPTEPPAITINDFVGSWAATSQVFTNNSNSSETFDLIAAGGGSDFTMLTGGGTRNWFDLGDFHDEWDALVTLDGATGILTSTPVEASRPTTHFTFKLEGNTLTLTGTDSSFDFTLTGAASVPATVVAVFTKK